MEELTDYDFNFTVSLIGNNDYNDKFCKKYKINLLIFHYINFGF
jgi:hypothetical protein